MLPDSTAADASVSDDVCTVTCAPPAFVFPNRNPLKVRVKCDIDGITAPAVVMTTEEEDVAPQVAVKPATLLPPTDTTGVMDGAKKESGYVSVMVPPDLIPPNIEGVKPSVASTAVFPALSSEVGMEKETSRGRVGKAMMRPKARANMKAKLIANPSFHWNGYGR